MQWIDSIKDITGTLWYKQEAPCLLCSGDQGPVCPACRAAYFLPDTPRCPRCGKIMETGSGYGSAGGSACRDCQAGHGPVGLAKVTVLGYYEGGWRTLIHNVKFRRQPYLLIPLGEEMARWCRAHLPVPDLVTAVPVHERRLQERGFNQAEVVGSILAWHVKTAYAPVLTRLKDTPTQVGLDRQERRQNVQGCFDLLPDWKGKNRLQGRLCWLTDDVTTTGATLMEGARVLMENGARQVFAFCLAAGRG